VQTKLKPVEKQKTMNSEVLSMKRMEIFALGKRLPDAGKLPSMIRTSLGTKSKFIKILPSPEYVTTIR
jgi:hypothetical protein